MRRLTGVKDIAYIFRVSESSREVQFCGLRVKEK